MRTWRRAMNDPKLSAFGILGQDENPRFGRPKNGEKRKGTVQQKAVQQKETEVTERSGRAFLALCQDFSMFSSGTIPLMRRCHLSTPIFPPSFPSPFPLFPSVPFCTALLLRVRRLELPAFIEKVRIGDFARPDTVRRRG